MTIVTQHLIHFVTKYILKKNSTNLSMQVVSVISINALFAPLPYDEY